MKRKIFFTLALLLTFGVMVARPIAQDVTSEIILSPAQVNLEVEPEQIYEFNVTLYNQTDRARTFETDVRALDAEDETGEALLLDDINLNNIQWGKFPLQKIVIPPRGKQEVEFAFAVREDTRPGGYQIAIVFRDVVSEQTGSNSTIVGEIGLPLFFNVFGAITTQAEVIEFFPQNYFNLNLPILLNTSIKDHAGLNLTPIGVIDIKNKTWSSNKHSVNFNEGGLKILASKSRTFETYWNPDNPLTLPGVYSAELTAAYGPENKVLTAQTEFVYIPWPLLVAISVVLLFAFSRMFRSKDED